MRTCLALLLLSGALVGGTAAQPPGPGEPTAPRKAPTERELDGLIAEAAGRNSEAAARKVVALGPAAVPALTQGLWADATTRRTCLTLLARVGPDARSAAPALVQLLADDSPEVKTAAARALGALGAHSARPALARLLDDDSAAVRLVAAEALIALSAPAEVVLPALTQSLKSERLEEGYAAARLLGDLGPEAAPAVPAINDRIATADPLLTARLAEVLGRIGPDAKDALPALKAKLTADKESPRYRVPAAVALWRVARDPDAAGLLRDALDAQEHATPPAVVWRVDPSAATVAALEKRLKAEKLADVESVARVLGTRSKETVPAVARFLTPNNALDRVRVALLLGEFGPAGKDGLETLRQVLATEPTPNVAFAAYRIAPTNQAARVLTDLLEDERHRLEAAEALKFLRPSNPAVVIELLAALDSPDEQVRLACAVALWRIEKHGRALPAVTRLLRSDDAVVRELAAVDLGGEFGADAKPAVPELVKRLFDPVARVRYTAAEALGRVGPGAKDAVRPLLALLGGDQPPFVHSMACEALGLIRPDDTESVVAALKAKLRHPDALVRAHAALALARVANDRSGAKEVEAGLTWRTHPVRITAAETLWLLDKDARVVPLLVRALEESNLEGVPFENERYMAARALGRIGADAKDSVPELVKLIDHRDSALATQARAALKAVDPIAAEKAGVK